VIVGGAILEEEFSLKGAKTQRRFWVLLCAFAPLREKFFCTGGATGRFCAVSALPVRATTVDT
jgi:hypothetical protein